MSNVKFFVIKIFEADEYGEAAGRSLGHAHADRGELLELFDQDLKYGASYIVDDLANAVEDALDAEE